jgi:SAM-dependent methyltransferase
MANEVFRHKRVAIDFDGTLFEDQYTIDESFEKQHNLKVKTGADEVTRWLKEQGFEILIFTCRPDYHRAYLEKQMKANNISHDYILFYTKPRVDLYIDDKGFRFENWDITKQWIASKLLDAGSLQMNSQQPDTCFEHRLRKEKIKHLESGKFKKVLDIGCGDGDVFEGVSIKGMALDGVEPDKNLREKAAQKKEYTKIYDSIQEVNIDDYDCVTALGVLEHVKDDYAFLKELKDAKNLYTTVPNADSFHRYFGVKLGLLDDITELKAHDHEVGHERYYTFAAYKKLMEKFCREFGFKIKSFGTTSMKVFSNIEMNGLGDRIEAFNQTGEELGLVGEDAKHGAELYCLLEKTK